MEQNLEVRVTREEVQSWLNDPVTKTLYNSIKEHIKDAHLRLGEGSLLDAESTEKTALNYAQLVGYIAGLRATLTIETEDGETINA